MHDFDHVESGSPFVEPLPQRSSDRRDSESPSGSGVLVDVLPPSATVVIRTRNSRYRVVVIDGATRHVRVQGGKLFPESTEMLLEGAMTDAGTINPGWISVGLPVAISSGLRRITTSRVESVAFERSRSATRAA